MAKKKTRTNDRALLSRSPQTLTEAGTQVEAPTRQDSKASESLAYYDLEAQEVLRLIDQDLVLHPEHLRELDADDEAQLRELTRGVKVDLNAVLDPADDGEEDSTP